MERGASVEVGFVGDQERLSSGAGDEEKESQFRSSSLERDESRSEGLTRAKPKEDYQAEQLCGTLVPAERPKDRGKLGPWSWRWDATGKPWFELVGSSSPTVELRDDGSLELIRLLRRGGRKGRERRGRRGAGGWFGGWVVSLG